MPSQTLAYVLIAFLAFLGGAVCCALAMRVRSRPPSRETPPPPGPAPGDRLEAVLQSLDGGVIVLDPDQRIANLNAASEGMLAVTQSYARGRLVQEALRQPGINRAVTEALAGRPGESEFTLSGDEPRSIRLVTHALHDASGRHSGLLLILNDLTHLRRLESIRTDFASNVSHELRTPITNIKGYAETLLDPGVASDAAQREQFLRVIARNADRLIAIVEDMLMLAQLERPESKETLSVEAARLEPIIGSVFASISAEAERKSITLSHEADPALVATLNPPLIEQALTNLVANAVRYAKPGTAVHVRAARVVSAAPPCLRIEVIDQGPGIAEEHLSRIFERFYRVDKDRGRDRGGTGLGLAIVKHIMNLHGGTVEVESVLGRGSMFTLLLPAS